MSGGRRPRSPRQRWGRLLLLLFPPRFRESWGGDLLEHYQDRGAAGARGWLRMTCDLVVNGVRLRFEDLAARARPPIPLSRARGERSGASSRLVFELATDLRQAARNARLAPGFTFAAVAVLAVGIGANTAVFSVVDGVLLNALRLDRPDRLVAVWHRDLDAPDDLGTVSPGNLGDWLDRLHSFQSLAAYSPTTATLLGRDEPRRVAVCDLVGPLFDVLGARASIGRLPSARDSQPDAGTVVALSDRLWREAYGADPGIVGETVLLDGSPATVVGVTAPEIEGLRLGSAEIFRVRVLPTWLAESRTEYFLRVIGRLGDEVAIGEAQAEIDRVMEQLRVEHPLANAGVGARVEPLHEATTASARAPLWALFAAVVLVLLIACVNLAHLLLVRIGSREADFATRRALGATTGRLLRACLVEALALATLGGLAGAALAWLLLPALVALLPSATPRMAEIAVDGRVLSFTVALSWLAGLVFGGLPAVRLPRAGALRARSESAAGTLRTGRRLVVAEIALAVVLLSVAGLLVRSVEEMRAVDLGFATEGSLTFVVRAAGEGYGRAERVAFYAQLLERLEALPGVIAAGASVNHPASSDRNNAWMRRLDAPLEDGETPPWTGYNAVTPGAFEALGIAPLRGRLFSGREGGPVEVVVSDAARRRFFPDDDPIGKRIGLGPVGEFVEDVEIVGIVPDVREGGITREPAPMVYFPYSAYPVWSGLSVTVRSVGDPMSMLRAATDAVHSIDASLPVYGARASRELVEDQVGPARALATLLSTFALLGLGLAALGVGGVLADSITRRRREIGIRMALGATSRRVVRRLLEEGLAQLAIGAGLGITAAVIAARALRGLLFRVSPLDGASIGATLAVLLVVGGLAVAVPAWRAARVQPHRVLRGE